jgi:fatty-acyl-CoA synthase
MRSSADWTGWTIGRALSRAARLWGERPFLIDGAQRLSFAETDREVDRHARGLLHAGIGRGDVVAIWLPNCIDWALLWLACARIGAAVVPINTRYRADEVEYVLRHSRAAMLVMAERFWTTDYLSMLRSFLPEIDDERRRGALGVALFPMLRCVVLRGTTEMGAATSLASLLASGDAVSDALLGTAVEAVDAEDTTVIVYTSGTSGRPKGARQSHRIVRNGANIGASRHYGAGDVVLGHMPFYHVAGSVATLIPALQFGQAVVLMHSWNPSEALALIEAERVNVFGGIPTHFIDLLQALGDRRLKPDTIHSAWIGGAAVPPKVARRAVEQLGIHSLAAVYGMTETGGATTYTPWGAPIELVCANKGPKIGDFELIVADPLSGAELPAGAEGEVRVRGYLVMQGYFEDEEATRAAITPDGWFRTGDLGRLDAAENLEITGRLKEMFIVGGSNAYPAEIERFIGQHPAVAQAVVCGVPDARLGEVCFAFVEPRPGTALDESEVIAFCRGRMADYKVPRFAWIMRELPRTATNKVERHTLQAMAKKIAVEAPRPTPSGSTGA